jgi:hypothetical protein
MKWLTSHTPPLSTLRDAIQVAPQAWMKCGREGTLET